MIDLYKRITLTLVLIFIFPSIAMAQTFHKHSDIKDVVRGYVQQQVNNFNPDNSKIELGRLDQRLKLTQCNEVLEIFSLTKFNPTGRNNIGVRCHSPRYWKIFIPVTIKFYSSVVIAAHPISRGSTLTLKNVILDNRQVANHLGGYFDSIEEALGREVRRPIRLGAIIQRNATEAEKVVKKGQIVTLRSGNSRFQVVTSGKALSDGALGDVIRVMNSQSQRVVEGRVAAIGVVEILN